MPSIYKMLGLTAGAGSEQVKAAFHRLAKSTHPDVNMGDVAAEGRFKQINQAYEILSDPQKRAAYDLGLKHRHSDAHRRVRNAMTTMAASFTLTVGCGLYFFQPAPSAHGPTTAIDAAEASNLAPTPADPRANLERATPPRAEPTRHNEPAAAAPAAKAHETKTAAVEPRHRTSPEPDHQMQSEDALHLHAMGMEQIGQGNVVAARSFFALAAKAGLKRSMRALAGTYDPVQLDKLKVLGMQPDVDAARMWYEKAGDLAANIGWSGREEWGLFAADKPSSKVRWKSTYIARETSGD